MNTEIQYGSIVDDLNLDPLNPRLGRENTGNNVSQEKVLSMMQDWTLEELAVSFVENGFWPQEALISVKEKLYGSIINVVVEGNRRLAALRLLALAVSGKAISRKWEEIIANKKIRFGKLIYAQSRRQPFLPAEAVRNNVRYSCCIC